MEFHPSSASSLQLLTDTFYRKIALCLHLTMRSTTKILVTHKFEQISYEAKKKKIDPGLRFVPLTTAYNHNHL